MPVANDTVGIISERYHRVYIQFTGLLIEVFYVMRHEKSLCTNHVSLQRPIQVISGDGRKQKTTGQGIVMVQLKLDAHKISRVESLSQSFCHKSRKAKKSQKHKD